MKRNLLLVAVVALIAFLMTWNFAPRVRASKDKRRLSASPVGKSNDKISGFDTRGQERSNAPKPTPVLLSQDNSAPPLVDLGLSRSAPFTGKSGQLDLDFDDPDLPSRSFLRNGIDEEEYHRLRDEYIASLRGLDLQHPFAVAAKRSEAINLMNDQQEQIAAKTAGLTAKTADLNALLSVTSWSEIGPTTLANGQYQGGLEGTVNGRATAVVVDPTDSNTIYLGTAQGGVWRSTNGGLSWTSIFDTAQSLAIGSIALAPSSPTTLYVGTGEPNNSGDSFFGVGVYRIDNAKTTATLNGPINPSITTGTAPAITYNCFTGRAISKIVVDEGNAANIFVSTSAAVAGAGGNALSNTVPPLALRGVFRSTNATAAAASVTFSKLIVNTDGSLDGAPQTGNTSIFDLVLEPGNSNNLLVSTSGAATGGAIYRSTNALAATPTFTQTLFPGFNGLEMKLTINKVGSVVTAYVATNEPSGVSTCSSIGQSGRVRKSIDGGLTWSTPLTAAEGYCGGQCSYDNPIAVDPTDANIVYLGGNARGTCSDVMKRSADGGTTFTRDDTNLHADAHHIFIDANVAPHKVWFANDGGIYSRNDAAAGTAWTSNNNAPLGVFQFVSVAVHPTDQNFTIGGTQDNGTEAQQTSAGNWTSAEGGDGGFALIDQSATDTGANLKAMYHTFFNQTNNLIGFDRAELGSCLSTKNSWEFRGVYPGQVGDPSPSCDGTAFDANPGFVLSDTVLFYAPMALGPGGAGNPNTLYFGTNKLYRSINRGDTMTIVSQNPLIAGVAISAIGISPSDDNVRIVGMRNGNVFATTTGSSTLTNTAFPFPTNATASTTNRHIGRAVIDPANSNTAYVTLSYYTNPATAGQIWRTTNLNSATPTWTVIGNSANGLPNIPVNAFAVDATDPSAPGVSVLYAGTDINVYRSRDAGATWLPFGAGLPRVAVLDMAIQPAGILRVATHGRGMWEIAVRPVNVAPVNTVPGAQNTAEDVPLVFTGATQISIADPDAGAAAVKVTLTAANGTISLSGTTGLSFTVGDGTSDATMTFTGTISDINTALNNLTFTPSSNYNGPASLTIETNDQGNTGPGGAMTDTDTVNITVTPVNDSPSFTIGPDQTVNEDAGPQSVPGWATAISSGPADESGQALVFLVTNNTNTALFSTQPAISSTGTLTYTPAANANGSAAITIVLMDNGGGADTSPPQTFNIVVNAVNDAPVNTVPVAQSVAENNGLTFSAANSNLISIADVDAGTSAVQVQLTATNGVITLSGISGLSFTVGDGTADATMTFTGTIANINAALNGMVFTPTAGFSGAAALQIVTNDQGNTGSGGALSDTDTVNITVNEGGTLQFGATTYSVSESGVNATITITRTGGTAGIATVKFSTSNGTATAGSDYTAVTNQTVTFNDGDTSKTVSVPITNDSLDENDETVNLTLSSAGGSGALGSPVAAVLTINDDDPTPSLSINDVSLAEGNSGTTLFRFTVTLSAASGLPVTVNYATANGTADASDYTAVPSTLLTFNAGDTSKTVDVLVNGDTLSEGNDTFFVNLSGATNATISDNQGLGTILNDDTPLIQFNAATYTINEGAVNTPEGFASLTVQVNRTGDLSGASTVHYATADLSGNNECTVDNGNASQRCDYLMLSGTLRFAAGEASKTFQIPIVNDGYVEGAELFTIELSNVTGGTLGPASLTTVTITDDDSVATDAAHNPYLSNSFFVRMNYVDFLEREPDTVGFNDWVGVLNGCGTQHGFLGAPAGCDRAHISKGFFGSMEFIDRGFLVYRLYDVGLNRLPLYAEFNPDSAQLRGFGLTTAEQTQNLNNYLTELGSRTEFVNRYAAVATTGQATQLVQLLETTAGVTLPATATTLPGQPPQYGRADLINQRATGVFSVVQTVKAFVEQKVVYDKYFPRGFVTMQYFAYLHRDPDTAGWNDWLDVLVNGRPSLGVAPGDYNRLIFGFIYSTEYRKRFGQP